MNNDLTREQLYQGVKQLIELDAPHVHLPQQKLFTLFSLAFQSLLYRATKNRGYYLIRLEDSFLGDKLSRKSKDVSTRKFMDKLLLPRKLNFEGSTLMLDFFQVPSWAMSKDIPREKFKGALIVKNTNPGPFQYPIDHEEDEATVKMAIDNWGEHFYTKSLQEVCPYTCTIAYQQKIDGLAPVRFPFITDNPELASGVKIASHLTDLDLDDDF
jgi:hypothetical protein